MGKVRSRANASTSETTERFPAFPRVLVALLQRFDMSQRDLAEASGLGAGCISELLRGVREISARNADKIGQSFEVHVQGSLLLLLAERPINEHEGLIAEIRARVIETLKLDKEIIDDESFDMETAVKELDGRTRVSRNRKRGIESDY